MTSHKHRLYLIGPVTGKPNDNIGGFERAREALRADGYAVDIPHDFVFSDAPYESAMIVSIHRLTMNDPVPTKARQYVPHYDGVALLDGWELSRGAKLERDIAVAVGIPCRPWKEWINPAAGAASMAASGAAQPVLAPLC